jgi:hypothetical protein
MKRLLSVCLAIVCFAALASCSLGAQKDSGVLESVDGIAAVDKERYSIVEHQFEYGDVNISYPIIEIYDSPTFSDSLNGTMKEILFVGETEDSIAQYEGVLYLSSEYCISYCDDELVSLYLHIDFAKGGSKGAQYSVGIVFSLSEQKIFSLHSMGIDTNTLVEAAKMQIVNSSPAAATRYRSDEKIKLIEDTNTGDTNNFFLGEQSVYLIISTYPMREYNGWIEIPLDWRGN